MHLLMQMLGYSLYFKIYREGVALLQLLIKILDQHYSLYGASGTPTMK
jgi:hypothetical protein